LNRPSRRASAKRRLSAAGLAIALAAAAAAATANPAWANEGPVPLTSAVSYLPWQVGIVGADDTDVVVERTSPPSPEGYPPQPLVAGALTGGSGQPLSVDSTGEYHGVAGTAAVSYEIADDTYRWQDLVTGDSGTGSGMAAPFGSPTFGPHGVLWVDMPNDGSGSVHLMQGHVEDGTVTDLGALPSVNGPYRISILDTAAEIDVLAFNDGVIDRVVPGSPTVTVTPPGGLDPLICTSATTGAIGCYGQNSVVRIPLDGSARVTTPTESKPVTVAVTPSATAWVVPGRSTGVVMQSTPATGGAVSTSLLDVGDFYGVTALIAHGDSFLLVAGTTPNEAGVYSLTDATDPGTLVLSAGPQPVLAANVAVTSGRIAWTSDRTDNEPVDSRPTALSSGGGLGLGSSFEVSPGAGYGFPTRISASGPRTAFLLRSTSKFDDQGNPLSVIEVADPDGVRAVDTVEGPSILQLSGNRVLYDRINSNSTATPLLYDLVHRTKTDLSSLGTDPSSPAVALWGNYLVWAKVDGSIWRRDLGSGVTTGIVGPQPDARPVQLFAWGDWVGWTGDPGGTTDYPSEWIDAATEGAPTSLPGTLLALTSDGALIGTSNGTFLDQYSVDLLPYGSDPAVHVTDSATIGQVGEDASIASWIDSNSRAWVMALPRRSDRARLLGDPSTPILPDPATGRWQLAVPISAPLTSCQGQITDGATVVRNLTCDPRAAAEGEISLEWDLTNDNGVEVNPGRYTWSVSAGNSDGPLLNAAGTSAAALSGTVYAPQSAAVTKSPTPVAVVVGHSASFSAAASGVPAPTPQWQRSTDGGKTWTSIVGATHDTLTFVTTAGQNGYRYRATFSNGWPPSAITAAATLTVNTAPQVTTQPSSVTVSAGRTVKLVSRATGRPTPTVQWQVSTDGGRHWANIARATSTTLQFTARHAASGYRYRARFHNVAGTAYSRSAAVVVR
jgi:hypothetical protein